MAETDTRLFAEEHLLLEDSQSSCFICSKYLSASQNQNIRSRQSIRTIFRHLQINPDNEYPVDLVPFCELCHQIFKTLSGYCADLEILQMRINYFLNELNKVIILKDTKEKVDPIDKARTELKIRVAEKCASNNSIGPLVSLPQLEFEQIGIATGEATNTTDLSTSSATKSQKIWPPKETYSCLECGCDFKSKPILREHSLVFHPEKYFPPKSDNLPVTEHKMYLTHLLNNEIDSCGSWKAGYNCVYCSRTFKKRKRQSIRMHLINDHKAELLKNHATLQQNISTELISKVVKMPISSNQKADVQDNKIKLKQFCKFKRRMRNEFTCSICGVCTTSLRQHEALHHPEKFLSPKRLEQVSFEQFKMYCVYLINKQVDNFAKCLLKSKIRFHCPHCKKSFIDLQSCRNHLILKHTDLMSMEIEKLQQNMTPEEIENDKTLKRNTKYFEKSTKGLATVSTITCEICGVSLTKRGMSIHWRKTHPNEYSNNHNCKECLTCKQKFRNNLSYNFHTTRFHANVVFEKWKTSLTTEEQFKMDCEYLIDTEISGLVQIRATDGKLKYQCSYCTTSFGDSKYARIHLVMEHKDILGRKIEEVQKNRVVRDTQDIIVRGEGSGEKIGEMDDYFEATEVFCDKSATKQEIDEIFYENDDEMNGLQNYDKSNDTNQ